MGRTSDAKERLLQSAAELFYSRAYSDVSVADLCAHAGVKKGSFYHFFPSKRDLALATIEGYGAQYSQMLAQAFDAPSLPAAQRIERMFDMVYQQYLGQLAEAGVIHGCPLGNLALELADTDEAIRQKLSGCFTAWQDGLKALVEELAAEGDVEIADPQAAATAAVAYAEGLILLAKTHNDPELLKRLAPGVIPLISAL